VRSRDAIGNPRPRLAPVSGLIQPRRAIWGRFTIDVLQCPPYLLRKELHARVQIVERQVRIEALPVLASVAGLEHGGVPDPASIHIDEVWLGDQQVDGGNSTTWAGSDSNLVVIDPEERRAVPASASIVRDEDADPFRTLLYFLNDIMPFSS